MALTEFWKNATSAETDHDLQSDNGPHSGLSRNEGQHQHRGRPERKAKWKHVEIAFGVGSAVS